jgi:hypothetical protein
VKRLAIVVGVVAGAALLVVSATLLIVTWGDSEPQSEDTSYAQDEAIDTLSQAMFTLDDLPSGFDVYDGGFQTLELEAERSLSPHTFRRQLQSWRFVLGHDKYFVSYQEQGMIDVYVRIYLLEDGAAAEEAFSDGAVYLEYPEADVEPISTFATSGDDSEAYLMTRPVVNLSGEEIQSDGYMSIVRSGLLLGVIVTASRTGEAEQREVEELASTLVSRMTQAQENRSGEHE